MVELSLASTVYVPLRTSLKLEACSKAMVSGLWLCTGHSRPRQMHFAFVLGLFLAMMDHMCLATWLENL